jgi:cell division septum initiation protein DivIVA
VNKQQYLTNLKTQCEIRENALKTAETLICAYQKENETLKEENRFLKDRLTTIEHQVSYLEDQSKAIKSMEKELFKLTQRNNELLENNIHYEQKVQALEKELDRVQDFQQIQNEAKTAKAKLKAKEERHRKDLESHFKNYLRLPLREDSFASSIEKKGER